VGESEEVFRKEEKIIRKSQRGVSDIESCPALKSRVRVGEENHEDGKETSGKA
jgi:hypothetical protein